MPLISFVVAVIIEYGKEGSRERKRKEAICRMGWGGVEGMYSVYSVYKV